MHQHARVRLSTPVTRIDRTADGNSYLVRYESDGELRSEQFDYVVVAAPVMGGVQIAWANETAKRAMHHTVAYQASLACIQLAYASLQALQAFHT